LTRDPRRTRAKIKKRANSSIPMARARASSRSPNLREQ